MRAGRLLLAALLLGPLTGFAQGDSLYVRDGDSIRYTYNPLPDAAQTEAPAAAPKKKDSWWHRLVTGNVDRTFERKLDVTFVAAPSYTKEASLGLGMLASGLYRIDRTDSITPPSDVSLFGNFSLSGFYMLGISGNTIFNHNRSRLTYEVSFSSKPLEFWGIGYDAGTNNPSSDYTRKQVRFDASYSYEIVDHTYIGPVLNYAFTKGAKFDRPEYIEGQKLQYSSLGLGAVLQYDSRDFIPNAQRGVFLMVKEVIFPKGLGTCPTTLFRTTFTADLYQRLWKGGVAAFDLYGEFNSEDTPWCMMAELGGGYRMRGYYMGRYLDNDLLSCQLELRQHIWRRFGCVAWVGAGTVLPEVKAFRWQYVLPNYGVGVRWEFKHRINVRIDYGFGQDTQGLVFNINEAF